MGADEIKAVADALRSIVLLAILAVLVIVGLNYRKEVSRKIDSLTEFSCGNTKLTFEARVELLRRPPRSGIVMNDQQLKRAINRAAQHQSELQGMRTFWVNNHPSDD